MSSLDRILPFLRPIEDLLRDPEITEVMVNVAQTTPEATIIVFEDVARENWAQAGKLASDSSSQNSSTVW